MTEASIEKVQEAVPHFVELLNKNKLNVLEASLVLHCLLRSVGESAYDRKDISPEAVLEEYTSEPSFPGALIVHADQILTIVETLGTKVIKDGRDSEDSQ